MDPSEDRNLLTPLLARLGCKIGTNLTKGIPMVVEDFASRWEILQSAAYQFVPQGFVDQGIGSREAVFVGVLVAIVVVIVCQITFEYWRR